MKKTFLLLLILCLLASSLLACSQEAYDLLYQKEIGEWSYCVRGSNSRARRIVVKKGDDVLWSMDVNVDKNVGNLNGTYGFAAEDMNFDGIVDLRIATSMSGECASYLCFLGKENGYSFERSDTLSGLCNIKIDTSLRSLFAFTSNFTVEQGGINEPSHHVRCDKATKYVWEDGVLTPDMYAAITYYSETDTYCYSVAYYDEELQEFEDSYDKWLSHEEYDEVDMSFLYYFR